MLKLSRLINAVWTILVGHWITLKHMLFEENITIQYPEEKPKLPKRFRGVLYNDTDACIGCLLCAKACPVDCIEIKSAGKGKNRWVETFNINISKCMWCELCVEACPDNVKCLIMTNEYEISSYSQNDLIYRFGKGPMKVLPEAPKPEAPPPVEAKGV